MAMTDPLADMLTRIRNGINAKKLVVECPDSNLKISVLKVLLKEGFIRGYNKKENDLGKKIISIELKYFEGKVCDKGDKEGVSSGVKKLFFK